MQMSNDLKHFRRSTKEVLKYFSVDQVGHLIAMIFSFSVAEEDKTKGRGLAEVEVRSVDFIYCKAFLSNCYLYNYFCCNFCNDCKFPEATFHIFVKSLEVHTLITLFFCQILFWCIKEKKTRFSHEVFILKAYILIIQRYFYFVQHVLISGDIPQKCVLKNVIYLFLKMPIFITCIFH